MILNVYAIHDGKADAFLQPFFMRTNGEAIRAFVDSSNNPDAPFHKWPVDFTLFHVGVWDDGKGVLEYRDKKSLGNGVELIPPEQLEAK